MAVVARRLVRKSRSIKLYTTVSEYADMIRRSRSLEECERIHEQLTHTGFGSHLLPLNLLIKMYASHGSLDRATQLFSSLPTKNVYTWTIMLTALAQNGHSLEALHLFKHMETEPDLLTFTIAFSTCSRVGSLSDAKDLHARFVASCLRSDVCADNALVYMFAESGSLELARDIFNSMQTRNVVSWNTIFAAYAKHGHFDHVLKLLQEFDHGGYKPDSVTFLAVLSGCSDLHKGKLIHSRTAATGFNSTVMQTTLLHMYSRCGSLQDARDVFERMEHRDLVTFNAMITVYAQSGHATDAVVLYRRLDLEGLSPNTYTYVGVLTACSSLKDVQLGEHVHARVVSSGAKPNYILDNALLNMYARCGRLADAEKVFESAEGRREVSSWNGMIAAYALHDMQREAVDAFHRMDVAPDSVTFTNVVTACSLLGDLEEARRVHARVAEHGMQLQLATENSLVKMYASCGSLREAEKAFEMISKKDDSSWNSLIAAYVEHGEPLKGLGLMRRMDMEGVRLGLVTFLHLLTACAAAGSSVLPESRRLHQRIVESVWKPDVKVYNALINTYARCGSLDAAREVFEQSPVKNDASWNAIMAAYAQHGKGAAALELFHGMELHGEVPSDITVTIVLLACNHAGLQEDAWYHFTNTSSDYGVRLGSFHYHCMIDLLGRVGLLEEAKHLISSMPYEARAMEWRGFLGACKTHGEGSLGVVAAEKLVAMEPEDSSPYMLLSGI